ncbi:hypothetical protein Tco_0516995 [Tanacetum coccineum]
MYHAMIICEKNIVHIPLGDETLTIRSNTIDGYASIVDSEQRAKLFGRIGTLERDNMRLRGMFGVERQRVDRLWRSMSTRYEDFKFQVMPFDLTSALEVFMDLMNQIRYHLVKVNVAANALSRNERAKPLRVGALVMTINSNLPPQIHEAQVEALKKENIKDENFMVRIRILRLVSIELSALGAGIVVLMARHGSRHHHLYQQVLDVFKDEGQLSEAIQFTGNRDHQKDYANARHKLLEFQVGDKVMLKASPWKGVMHFGKRGKRNPRIIPLDEIQIDDTLHFIKELVKIMDREVKRLKKSRIPIVKVRWNSRRGPEFTWEREDQF